MKHGWNDADYGNGNLFSLGATSPSGPGLPHYRGFTIILRHSTIGRIPLYERSAWPRNVYLKTRDSNNRQISMPRRIQFRNPIMRAAMDPRLRPRDNWDRLEREVLRRKLIPQALCSPQFPQWIARGRTCVSEVIGRSVTTRA